MFSNRSSRSSSAHSLSRALEESEQPNHFDVNVNIIEQAPVHDGGTDTLEGILPPGLSDDNAQNPDIQLSFTKNHPMGQILLNLLRDTFQLAKKTNVKEMDSDVTELCSNFYNAMRMSNMATKHQIQQTAKEIEKRLIEKELNSHLLHENTDPPRHFSSVPTLQSTHQRNEALKSFPTRHPKFSGTPVRDGGMDILEFLSAMNTAQEYCRLSEKEFKEFLLLCTTGRAHTLLMEWIRLGENVPTLYHSLLMHFDKRMTPQSAKELLFNYKAPKNLTLRDVETNIMLWVSRAATIFPAGPSRVAYYNLETVEALIRCLPPTSSARVQSVYNTLSARLGRAALATELSRALNIERHAIDLDIKHNGVDRNFNTHTKPSLFAKRKSSNARKTSTFAVSAQPLSSLATQMQSASTFSVDAAPQYIQRRDRPSHQKSMRDKQITYQQGISQNRKYPVYNVSQTQHQPFMHRNTYRAHNNRFSNSRRHSSNNVPISDPKNYCSLCGKKDHVASQGCPFMVSDSGVRINAMPTHQTCTVCPPKVNPRLNHPVPLCPYRIGGPFHKQH